MKTALFVLALVASLFNRVMNAECLVPPPPCEALARMAIVVVVDVMDAAEPWVKVDANHTPLPQAVRLKVVERFKGVLPQQQEITGHISNSAESVFLETGKRYLLYALQSADGTLVTSCSRTKLADVAGAELRQLRQCSRP